MANARKRIISRHAAGRHHSVDPYLFGRFDSDDMVESHGHGVQDFRQQRNIMHDHGIWIVRDRLPLPRQRKIIDQRMLDIVQFPPQPFRVGPGEHVLGDPSSVEPPLIGQRVGAETFRYTTKTDAAWFHHSARELVIVDEHRTQLLQPRGHRALAGRDAACQSYSHHISTMSCFDVHVDNSKTRPAEAKPGFDYTLSVSCLMANSLAEQLVA